MLRVAGCEGATLREEIEGVAGGDTVRLGDDTEAVDRVLLDSGATVILVGVVTRDGIELVHGGVVTRGVLTCGGVVVRAGAVTRDGAELVGAPLVRVEARSGVVARVVLSAGVIVRIDGVEETPLPLAEPDGATVSRVERDDRPVARVMLLPGVTKGPRVTRLLVEGLAVVVGDTSPDEVPREAVLRIDGEFSRIASPVPEAVQVPVSRAGDEPAVAVRTAREPPARACSAS